MQESPAAVGELQVEVLYGRDPSGVDQLIEGWLNRNGEAVCVHDIQIRPGSPTVVMIVYRKRA